MTNWKRHWNWICFKENGLFPRVQLMMDIMAIQDCVTNEMIYGTSFQLTIERKWWSPMRWLFGRKAVKCLDPRNVLIKKFESKEPKWFSLKRKNEPT